MLERCPTCRKTIGTLKESGPDKSGLTEIRSDVANEVLGSLSPSPAPAARARSRRHEAVLRWRVGRIG